MATLTIKMDLTEVEEIIRDYITKNYGVNTDFGQLLFESDGSVIRTLYVDYIQGDERND